MRGYIVPNYFKKQLRPYHKKYRQLLSDVIKALENFNELQADNLGANVYKVRLRVTGLARGKSGLFRLLVLVVTLDNLLVPVTLYFKGDQASISGAEIKRHVEAIQNEIGS